MAAPEVLLERFGVDRGYVAEIDVDAADWVVVVAIERDGAGDLTSA